MASQSGVKKKILSRNVDLSGNYIIEMVEGDLESVTPLSEPSQAWNISLVVFGSTDYFQIRTMDYKCLTAGSSDNDIHSLSVEEVDNERKDQLWIPRCSRNEWIRFESVAFPGTFLAKISDDDGQAVVVVSPVPEEGTEEDILVDWVIIDSEEMIYYTNEFVFTQFTPAINFYDTTVDKDNNCQIFYPTTGSGNTKSRMIITYSLPAAYTVMDNISMIIFLKHQGTYNGDNQQITTLDINLNENSLISALEVTMDVDIYRLTIPIEEMNIKTSNVLEITLPDDSGGVYCLYNVNFEFINTAENYTLSKFRPRYGISHDLSGVVYNNIELSDDLNKNRPYLDMKGADSVISVIFSVPQELASLENGFMKIYLNHASITNSSIINLTLNGVLYHEYLNTPVGFFDKVYLSLPFNVLNTQGVNKFVITLSESSPADYLLSDIALVISADQPKINPFNFEKTVKQWILNNRKNIDELNQIPRDDMSALQFLLEAPSWFFLPYLAASPSEILVLIKHFPLNFYFIAMGVRDINRKARNFRSDLISTDLPKKNSLRHSLWMALITSEYDDQFAQDLGDAHENAHVDLTIEGPFDHVTDRINNMVGIQLAKNNPAADCEDMVIEAWDNGHLAWAKNFRVEDEQQLADVYWQIPLDYLATTYDMIPDFNEFELRTLARFNVTLPVVGGHGHDEL